MKNNKDVKDFIDGIRKIDISSPTAEITGLRADDIIKSLKIQADFFEIITENQGYTLYSGSNITLDNIIQGLDQVSELIGDWADFNIVVHFKVSGTSSSDFGTRVKVNIKLPATLIYSPI